MLELFHHLIKIKGSACLHINTAVFLSYGKITFGIPQGKADLL